MVVLPIVNMLLSLVGFLAPWRKKSPVANRELAGDSAAILARTEQLTEVAQKG
jgi:hypothetical protein